MVISSTTDTSLATTAPIGPTRLTVPRSRPSRSSGFALTQPHPPHHGQGDDARNPDAQNAVEHNPARLTGVLLPCWPMVCSRLRLPLLPTSLGALGSALD